MKFNVRVSVALYLVSSWTDRHPGRADWKCRKGAATTRVCHCEWGRPLLWGCTLGLYMNCDVSLTAAGITNQKSIENLPAIDENWGGNYDANGFISDNDSLAIIVLASSSGWQYRARHWSQFRDDQCHDNVQQQMIRSCLPCKQTGNAVAPCRQSD